MNHNLHPRDLILIRGLSEDKAHSILNRYGFQDCDRAYRNLQNLAGEPPLQEAFAEIIELTLRTFADSADPDAALNNFDRFAGEIPNRTWLYHLLHDAPFLLRILAVCFGSSTYLSDILVRNPEHFNELIDAGVMNTPKNREIMYAELSQSVDLFRSIEQKLSMIRRYKRKESLRIGVRDLLEDANLETTTLELTHLAEATLQICYEIGVAELTPKLGIPLAEDKKTLSNFAIIGMGKFGGCELNFSSDIDVMFVYSDEGQTEKDVENSEYFGKLCEFIIKAMSEVTASGYVFRVDVRLRPESSVGTIVRSIEGYEAYYEG
jgi:glutamate-ammonia-ligase adenylyltransferase